METRRLEIIKGIFNEGKLTESLYNNIKNAHTLTELEDIWLPFKKKKKTRGMMATERGLVPLAEIIKRENEETVLAQAVNFIKQDAEDEKLNVLSVEDAIQGVLPTYVHVCHSVEPLGYLVASHQSILIV